MPDPFGDTDLSLRTMQPYNMVCKEEEGERGKKEREKVTRHTTSKHGDGMSENTVPC